MLCHTSMAEMAHDSRFDNHRLIYRDVEAAQAFDIPKLFGKTLEDRLETSREVDTIQDFTADIWEAIEAGDPFVYVLDSFDSMTSEEELAKTEAKAAGKKVAGSYGVDKTKGLSALLRQIIRALDKSLLVIVSQVREHMDAGLFEPKLYRTGGRSLGHHSSHEVWLYKSATLKRTAKGRERPVGVTAVPKVTKNRLTGKMRSVEFPIFYDYGVDDVTSCVDFLIKEGFWKKVPKGQIIDTKQFGLEGSRQNIISQIEEQGLEIKLRKAVGKAWAEIEESLKLERKRRFE